MDRSRRSGTYARPNDDYFNSQQAQEFAPSGKERRSFSDRAGQQMLNDLGDDDVDDDDDREYSQSTRISQQGASSSRPARANSYRMREPQAALHVPKPRNQNFNSTYDNNRRVVSENASAAPGPGRSGSRRGSVPDRSPLQKLEGNFGDMSKEEKRARMEEAEQRARQRAPRESRDRGQKVPIDPSVHRDRARRRSEGDGTAVQPVAGRVSSGQRHNQMPSESTYDQAAAEDRYYGQSNDRTPTSQRQAETGNSRGQQPSQALREHGEGHAARHDSDRRKESQARPDRQSQDVRPEKLSIPQSRANRQSQDVEPNDIKRSDSKSYRHRSRNAGFAGAEAAIAAAVTAAGLDGADKKRGDRRQNDQTSDNSRPFSQGNITRSDSKRIQKKNPPAEHRNGNRNSDQFDQVPASQQQLQTHRIGTKEGIKAAIKHQDPDPLPPSAVRNPRDDGPTYQVPPQTAAGQAARNQVAFNTQQPDRQQGPERGQHHHKLGDMFHRHRGQDPNRIQTAPLLDEWRKAGVAKLELDDLAIDAAITGDRSRRTDSSSSGRPANFDGAYEEESRGFKPPLFLRCGPLLRYTGMRRERRARPGSNNVTEREIWRGSIMVVTEDSRSSYERAPVLRLFAQPMDLLPPPPTRVTGQLPFEHVDPLAGQVKLSREGQALYVKPADALEQGVDLSQVEDDSGIFETSRSSNYNAQHSNGQNSQRMPQASSRPSRIRARDGEKAKRYREVKGARLHAERGVTFWRFNIEIELGVSQARVAYRINKGPAIGFWVPGRGQTMNIMFHSCNGFSLSVNPDQFSGPDPLWRDVMTMHQSRPFHVMLGGGDQIYNDAAMRDTDYFREWLQIKNPEHKHKAEFSPEMQNELESFYLDRYCMWFSQGLFSMANSQIPMVNIWDDHDIIDGFGSYPHHFMSSKVFSGLGAVAFKYYMLFQHQSLNTETPREEPSWLLGSSPGPYINEYSRSLFMFLGRKLAFLGLDCRTERMRDEILSQNSYDLIFSRLRGEIIIGETKHLIVLLGVPIAYPRLNFLENVLTSRMMDPIKALGRTGLLGGFVNKFDGGVEILDDLDDHWTAKHHKQERNWFIQELQELAAEKSVRITILGGDVHLGAVGQFYTPKKFGVPKDCDHRYMPNIVSSAIVNTPPPSIMGDVLNKRNKVHHLDTETDEDMIPMFDYDVDGRPRNNHHLLPRRNYCTIREYIPGSTPPPSPGPEDRPGSSRSQAQSSEWADDRDRKYPPGSMGRSRSFSRDGFRPGNLIRRLSGSRSKNPPVSLRPDQVRAYEDTEPVQRSYSLGGRPRVIEDEASYFPQQSSRSNNNSNTAVSTQSDARPVRPTSMFHRRPTDLTVKAASQAAAKGGPDGNLDGRNDSHLDLEGGLDVTLNMEIDQHDPSGNTVGYRLLVPALFYEGPGDANTTRYKSRRASFMDRIRGRRDREEYDDYSDEESRSPSPEGRNTNSQSVNNQRPATAVAANRPMRDERNERNDRNDQNDRQAPSTDMRNDTRARTNVRNDDQAPYTDGTSERPVRNNYGPPRGLPNPSYRNQGNDQTAARGFNSKNTTGPLPRRDEYDDESIDERPRRRFRFPSFRRKKTQDDDEGYGRERYGDDSEEEDRGQQAPENEMTPSELESLEDRQMQRRPSKAERFFGVGNERLWGNDGNGGARLREQEAEMEERRPGWKIWR